MAHKQKAESGHCKGRKKAVLKSEGDRRHAKCKPQTQA
jgi:hypothetical protein